MGRQFNNIRRMRLLALIFPIAIITFYLLNIKTYLAIGDMTLFEKIDTIVEIIITPISVFIMLMPYFSDNIKFKFIWDMSSGRMTIERFYVLQIFHLILPNMLSYICVYSLGISGEVAINYSGIFLKLAMILFYIFLISSIKRTDDKFFSLAMIIVFMFIIVSQYGFLSSVYDICVLGYLALSICYSKINIISIFYFKDTHYRMDGNDLDDVEVQDQYRLLYNKFNDGTFSEVIMVYTDDEYPVMFENQKPVVIDN